jgi:hypothetical protein
MRYAERARIRQENEANLRRDEKRRKRNWKRIAGLPAFCYSCKQEMTYAKLFTFGAGRRNPHGKANRCEKCFDAELNDLECGVGSERYPGEEIFWRLG